MSEHPARFGDCKVHSPVTSASCRAITPFQVKRLVDVSVVQVVHQFKYVLSVLSDITTEAQSAEMVRWTAPEMSAMMIRHLSGLLSICRRKGYDFTPEQTAIEKL